MSTGPDLPVPQHRWRSVYWLGGAVGILLVLALLSGSVLAVFYEPTPDRAHESVRRIVDEIPSGAWLRGVHVWASRLTVVALVLHLLTVLVTAGFRRPRQWTWVVGVGLASIVAAFTFTGRVLPQDQVAQRTAAVVLSLVESLPALGHLLRWVSTGGTDDPGPLLNRFHALHTIVLPVLLVSGVAGHVLLVHRHGLSVPPWIDRSAVAMRSSKEHLRREVWSWAAVTLTVFVSALVAPVGLGPPAGPASSGALPTEWHLRPLEGLMGALPPQVVSVGLVLATIALAALPFVWRRRPGNGVPSDLARGLESTQYAFVLLTLVAANLSVAVSQIALGVALVLALTRWIVVPASPPRLGVELASAALAVWALLMIPLSEEPSSSVVSYKRFYLFTAMWVAASVVDRPARRRAAALALICGAVAMALWGMGSLLAREGTLFVGRAVFVSNAMTSGALFMLPATVIVGLLVARVGRVRTRAILVVALVVVVFALLHTVTRSAILGTLIGVLAMLLVARARGGWVAASVVVALALLFAFGSHVLPTNVWNRISPERLADDTNAIARLEMWGAGLRLAADHPWTGVGDVSLGEATRPYYVAEPTRLHGHLHSNLVQVLVIWGVPGLLLFLWWSGSQFRAAFARWIEDREQDRWAAGWSLGAIGAFVAFFVAGLTEWYFGDAEVLLMWMLILGIGAAPRRTTA